MLGTVAALGLSHSMEEWLGLANLIATLPHHWGRAFDQAPSGCNCLCKAASLCALVPASAWAALGAFLFVVGLVTGLSCGACWFGPARVRRGPAGADIRPGAFTGPVSPASLRQLQQ